jgi:hypothetical protein
MSLFYGLISLLAFLGNSLVIYVVATSRRMQVSPHHTTHFLIVHRIVFKGINEKLSWVRTQKHGSGWVLVWDPGDQWLFAIRTCSFLVKHLFPYPLAPAQLIGDFMTNRQSGNKMFLSAITAPIYSIGASN